MMVKYGKESGNYQISGTNSDEIKIENRLVTDGRYINASDVTRQQNVAVIGRLVQKDLIKMEVLLVKESILTEPALL